MDEAASVSPRFSARLVNLELLHSDSSLLSSHHFFFVPLSLRQRKSSAVYMNP
jgi:hypothetical protein